MVGLWVLLGLFQALPLDAEDKAVLERGEVVVRRLTPTGDAGVSARAFGLVDAPPGDVFPLVRDCEHFSEYMPRIESSKLLSRLGDELVCELEVHMPFPISNLTSTTKSMVSALPGGGFERRWTLVEGDYRRNDGSWKALPWGDDGRRTLLVYWLDVDPKVMVPDAIIRKAQTGSLPDVFEAVRTRLKKVRGGP